MRDRKGKSIVALCGAIIFVVGMFLFSDSLIGIIKAIILTNASNPPCPQCIQPIDLSLSVSSNIITDSDTVVLTIYFRDSLVFGGSTEKFPIILTAPGFSPGQSERTILLPNSSGYLDSEIRWVLTPTKLGTFQIVVEADSSDSSGSVVLSTRYIGITVTNAFGLRNWEVQLISFISTFLGPALTLPWWYDRWKERKKKQNEKSKQEISQPSKRRKRNKRNR